jgi:hypothetical protein
VRLSSTNFEAVEPAPIPPIHPLAESAVVRVAVVVGVIGGVGIRSGLLIGAIHSVILPFYTHIIAKGMLHFFIITGRRAGPLSIGEKVTDTRRH